MPEDGVSRWSPPTKPVCDPLAYHKPQSLPALPASAAGLHPPALLPTWLQALASASSQNRAPGAAPQQGLGPAQEALPWAALPDLTLQRGPSRPATVEWSEVPLFSVMSLPTSPLPSYTSLSHVRLCNPMNCTGHGILQARMLEWVALPFSRGSS